MAQVDDGRVGGDGSGGGGGGGGGRGNGRADAHTAGKWVILTLLPRPNTPPAPPLPLPSLTTSGEGGDATTHHRCFVTRQMKMNEGSHEPASLQPISSSVNTLPKNRLHCCIRRAEVANNGTVIKRSSYCRFM
ncbi:hypothetical protein E2C01_085340 [Portunus trituberculatus]|uniref:Uncharacterized protein n=1 Tax=Portunus trituberculatus TaxID=210409 RepID=A0A5B7J6H9_PORTR|nr:hypothetical protein [Portunus trituberculatus]